MILPEHDIFPHVQFAFGGVVWRQSASGPVLALVHRPRYDDWTLPKGKPDPGETPAETAWREVREEIACEARFLDFAGVSHYATGQGKTKVVLYWHMVLEKDLGFSPNEEVDQVVWLSLKEAANRLTHERERELLAIVKAPPPQLS